jgi:lipoprotein-releasing system permease protein
MSMLSLTIAARFLRKSPIQSILIVAGIAVGIGVQVFLGSLITSLQASLVDQTIGHSPQVMVQSSAAGQPIVYGPALRQTLTSQPGITTVVPTRTFSAIFRQGQVSAPLELTGGELDQLNTIYDISRRISAGKAQLGRETYWSARTSPPGTGCRRAADSHSCYPAASRPTSR